MKLDKCPICKSRIIKQSTVSPKWFTYACHGYMDKTVCGYYLIVKEDKILEEQWFWKRSGDTSPLMKLNELN